MHNKLAIMSGLLLLIVTCVYFYVKKSGGASLENRESVKSKVITMQTSYPQALVDFEDFKSLVSVVESHRAERLIDFDTFLSMSKEAGVVILDSRSDFRYNRKHIKGAIHLDFSDYTLDNLRALIPDPHTKILIYCNNNFDGDHIDFAPKGLPFIASGLNAPLLATPNSGSVAPVREDASHIQNQILANRKPVMLALNIPTYINLFGYGYVNVYELNELVNIRDARVTFEGTEVK